ncbi:uncharacterized protein LOC112461156 [Temnothorax curvispinosus]|uniref:Uncharacterized protein LOC112461156 n=1 Tax=Temnothorax curvispinosus TaxID=300111 RepID=A0A6J1QM14_9HYME|nr:uncharacterized protein LOC112461156 [Temnothorax curvispinosus]
MAYDHTDYCHNINMSENEENKNLNSEVTLLDDEDKNFDDLLISIVKEYPHLYDSSCKDYRDVIKKENSWLEISKILATSPDVCCNRWTRLRESFSKEKKKRQNETTRGSGASKRRGFVYFESMKYIDKFVKTRKSITNIKLQKTYNISDCLKDKNLNKEVTLLNDEDKNFDDLLIRIVKEYPHLYDSSCKDYRDVIKKENSWLEISKILATSPDVCCNRWTRLRESFSKEKKKRQNETTCGSGASKRRGFVYFESMKYIDKFVKTRKSITNIKLQKTYNISDCLKDKNLNKEISNWVQHGKQTLEKERTSLEQIDANIFSPIKKCPIPETSPTISNFDDASCASFLSTTESSTNDFKHELLSTRSSSDTINFSRLSSTSVRSTGTFKKPSYAKGKFNPNISIKKDGKNTESENDKFKVSFINLNQAVTEHLNSKKDGAQMQNDPDTLFCNLVMAELKQLDNDIKQVKKQEIMQILWRKKNL